MRYLWPLALVACSSAPPPAVEVVSAEVAAPSPYVLVRAAAKLHVAPDASAPALAAYAVPTPASGRPEFVDVYRLLGERDGWLELESVPESTYRAHCNGNLDALHGLRLRLFAPVADRVLVTTREVRAAYDDGTAVSLAPGMPLWPEGQPGLYSTMHGSLTLAVHVPADAVGTAYEPGAQWPEPESPRRMLAQAAVRDGALRFGRSAVAQPAGLFSVVLVTEEKPLGDAVLATVPRGCLKLEVRVKPEEVQDYVVGGLLGRTDDSLEPPYARAKSRLFWDSGAPAGEATQDFGLGREVVPAPGRRCFEKPLRYIRKDETNPNRANFLRLCLDPADVAS